MYLATVLSTTEAQWTVSGVNLWDLSILKWVKTCACELILFNPLANGSACVRPRQKRSKEERIKTGGRGRRALRQQQHFRTGGLWPLGNGGEIHASFNSDISRQLWPENYCISYKTHCWRIYPDWRITNSMCGSLSCHVCLQIFTLNNFLISSGSYNQIWI